METEKQKQKLMKFIEEKRKFEVEGYKVFWIFELVYIDELRELYGKKMMSLENRIENIDDNPPKKLGDFLMCGFTRKKFDESVSGEKKCQQVKFEWITWKFTGVKIIHVASRDGFSNGDLVFIDNEDTDESNKVKSERFVSAVKKIVGNKTMIPDKSLLIVSQQKHHLKSAGPKSLKENHHGTLKMKQRQKQSQVSDEKFSLDHELVSWFNL